MSTFMWPLQVLEEFLCEAENITKRNVKIVRRASAETLNSACTIDIYIVHEVAASTHLPAFSSGLTEEVVYHVKLLLFYHNETLLFGIFPIYFWWPLNKKRVQVIHPVNRKVRNNGFSVTHEYGNIM